MTRWTENKFTCIYTKAFFITNPVAIATRTINYVQQNLRSIYHYAMQHYIYFLLTENEGRTGSLLPEVSLEPERVKRGKALENSQLSVALIG